MLDTESKDNEQQERGRPRCRPHRALALPSSHFSPSEPHLVLSLHVAAACLLIRNDFSPFP